MKDGKALLKAVAVRKKRGNATEPVSVVIILGLTGGQEATQVSVWIDALECLPGWLWIGVHRADGEFTEFCHLPDTPDALAKPVPHVLLPVVMEHVLTTYEYQHHQPSAVGHAIPVRTPEPQVRFRSMAFCPRGQGGEEGIRVYLEAAVEPVLEVVIEDIPRKVTLAEFWLRCRKDKWRLEVLANDRRLGAKAPIRIRFIGAGNLTPEQLVALQRAWDGFPLWREDRNKRQGPKYRVIDGTAN